MFSRVSSSLFVVFLAVFTVLFPGLTARYATPSSATIPATTTAATGPSPAPGAASDDSSGAPAVSSRSSLSECEGRLAGPVLRLLGSNQAAEPPRSWRVHTLSPDSGSWTSTSRPGAPAAVAVSANGATTAWIGADGGIGVAGADGGGGTRRLRIEGAAARALALSPEGDALAALDTAGALWLWKPLERDAPESLACGRQGSGAKALAMSSGQVACGSADDGVYLVDYRSGARRPAVRISADTTGPVRSLAFSPDGTSLAFVGDSGTPGLLRVDGGPRHGASAAPGGHYEAGPPAFSADERTLAFPGGDGALWRWEVGAPGSTPVRIADDATPEGPVVFAPGKGRRLAYATATGVTILEPGAPKRTLATGRVLGLQFALDGGVRVEALPVAPAHDAHFVSAARALASAPDRPRLLLATVPDPIDSGEYAQADQIIESISQGIESSGPWLRDRFWLPWRDLRPRPSGEHQPSEQCRAQVPGVIVFRSTASSRSSQPRALVLLLVGETPTWGVHKPALMDALDFIEEASGDPDRRGLHNLLPVDVIGPTFSGSAASIRSTVAAWTAAGDGRQSDCFTFLSGSATADVNRSQLDTCGGQDFESSADCADTCGAGSAPYLEFHATVLPDSVSTRRFMEYLHAGAGAQCSQIAVLKESGTAYAADRGAEAEDAEGCADPLTMRFPLHISAVRRAYDAAAQAGTAPPGSTANPSGMNLNPSLDEPADPLDVPPSLSPRTPFTNDLVLSALLRELSRRDVRFIGLQATDPSDVVFLAQQVRARMPDARLYVFGSDLLYTHPKFTPALLGAYVVSSYPLFLAGQAWVREPLMDVSAFPSDAGEGVFNAARAFLDRDIPSDRDLSSQPGKPLPLLDYFDEEGRGGQLPSAWVSLVGLGGFWPVARLDPGGDTTAYVLDARRAPASVSSEATIVLQPDPKPPLEWWLALGAAVALCGAHANGQWRGLRNRPRYIFELVGFREPVDPSLKASHHAHAAACAIALLAAAVPVCVVGSGVSGAPWLRVAAWIVTGALFGLAFMHRGRAAQATRDRVNANPGTTPVSRALLQTASQAAPAIVWCLLAWVAAIAIAAPPPGTDGSLWGALVCARVSELGSGLSPVVPLVALSMAVYAWHASQVIRIRERDGVRDLLLANVFASRGEECVASLEANVRDALERSAPSPALAIATGVAAITTALFAAHWPSSLESAALANVALRVALAGAAAGVTVAVVSLVEYWLRLDRLLARLSSDPMVGGFDRLPRPFVRSLEDQIASAPVGARGLHTLIRQLELLEANRKASGPPPSALAPLYVPGPQVPPDGERQASVGEVAPEDAGPTARVLDCLLCEASALRSYLSTVWSRRSLASTAELLKEVARDALLKPRGADAIPNTLALTNPSVAPATELWIRLAEEYVACVATLILDHLVRHFRNLLATVTSGVLLLMIAVSSYPLQPRRELMAGVWVLTIAAVSASAYTLFALERNELLSRIAKKEPGRVSLDRTFLTGLFMWALLPILGLLAVQYPEIAGQLFSFLSPASGKTS
jgi:hypothetical protein